MFSPEKNCTLKNLMPYQISMQWSHRSLPMKSHESLIMYQILHKLKRIWFGGQCPRLDGIVGIIEI